MTTPPPPPPHWDQRQARKDWEDLSPACRSVLLGERPRGVAKALRLLSARGLIVGFLPTARGEAARQWGLHHGDLGWASWPVREPGIDALWLSSWLAGDYDRWRAVLRAGANLPAIQGQNLDLWENGAALAKECLTEPVRLCKTMSDACIHHLLHSTVIPGQVGWAIHGGHRRVHATLAAFSLVEEIGGCSYYTPLGRATVAVWRGPREFQREEMIYEQT